MASKFRVLLKTINLCPEKVVTVALAYFTYIIFFTEMLKKYIHSAWILRHRKS